MKTEGDVEEVIVAYAESLGGRMPKAVSPGRRGFTDRILLLPFCPVIFVEVKRPGRSRDEPLQDEFRRWCWKNGHRHWKIDDLDDFKARVSKLYKERP